MKFKKERGRILNSTYTLMKTYEFFKNGHIPRCSAGRRFLVIRPDGILNPCSMQPQWLYSTQGEMIEDFSKDNECGECYVAIRAYSDKSFGRLVWDNLLFLILNGLGR